MSSDRKAELRALAKETFYHAFDTYMRKQSLSGDSQSSPRAEMAVMVLGVGFPLDEVRPLSCQAVGHDYDDLDNTEVNDVNGDYALQLVDSLAALAVLGDRDRFDVSVRQAIASVHFDRDVTVQVFEVTIRMLGGLLAAHQIATDTTRSFFLPWYNNELLALAADLGARLLPAFATPTGLPLARVNLQRGIARSDNTETCAAGAGSLVLEFAVLSRLTGNPAFELAARRAFFAVWNRRSDLNLVGNTIDAVTGQWRHAVGGIGAGIDSFYEYAAKAYVLLGEDEWWRTWENGNAALMRHVRVADGFLVSRVVFRRATQSLHEGADSSWALRAVSGGEYAQRPSRERDN